MNPDDGRPRAAHDERLEPDTWGIHRYWMNSADELVEVPGRTIERLRTIIGRPPDDLAERAPLVTQPGRDLRLGVLDVECEDGQRRTIDGIVPDDFPLGYHDTTVGGIRRRLIVSPGSCWLPPGRHGWGWAVQLYAARSRDSGGIGDLADLRTIRVWAQGLGASFLLVNPLHAVAPTFPQEPSPYLPASRRFRNPLYLRVAHVAHTNPVDELIDRDAVWRAKRTALEAEFATRSPGAAFHRWRAEQGMALEAFATWCVLAEHHGPDWQAWPTGLHDPNGAGVRGFAREHAERVTFHAWLQWRLDEQFTAAAGETRIVQDLPVGVDGGGADAWMWQETVAAGATVGAPPDVFNAQGQGWGSPPMAPWRLRLANYEPFVESIRATMSGGGGIRIDHVMGLFRLWWIPEGLPPSDGAYVRYPSQDLLDIVALESHRAQAVVVGEDLGTVEPGVRETLQERAVLSYRLLWFEDAPPEDWPELAMAAITTHDLPTVAGLWTGADLEDQVANLSTPRPALERDRAALLSRLPSMPEGADGVALAAHRTLAGASSMMISATLEDAVGQQLRPNIPGTRTRPNWSIPLPVRVDDLPNHAQTSAIAKILQRGLPAPSGRD